MNIKLNNYIQNIKKLHNIEIPQILDYTWFQLFKQQIFFKYKRYNALCQATYNDIMYISNKYINIFNLKEFYKLNYNLINLDNIQNTILFVDLIEKIIDKNIANKFKEKINLLNCNNKKITIFNLDYLIKNKQFNKSFNFYLNKKNINLHALYEATDCINCKYLFYSRFFNYFFNFIIYKAQTQNNQKFGFNSLMSIKAGQKIQADDLDEVYIYIYKDLGITELNRQLSYIINRILES